LEPNDKGIQFDWHEFNVTENPSPRVTFLGLNLAENIDNVFRDGKKVIASLLKALEPSDVSS
jgi:hypothetical protein